MTYSEKSNITKNPTPYPDLNDTLAKLVGEIRERLAGNFVGAYLQGSFATGDFTDSSDVDMLIVIQSDITNEGISVLQSLHQKLFRDLPKPWGQRIELSYAPKDVLRHWSESPRDPPDFPRPKDWTDPSTNSPPRAYPFWYLDNGADHLIRSEHDNSRVVRWITREKGIVLSGPNPRTLIDPVTHKDLALEIRDTFTLISEKWATVDALKTRMLQTFFVTLYARALHTLETGTVTSKKTSTEWALSTLDSKWHSLIEKAWDAWRGSREHLSSQANGTDAEQTILFMEYALKRADNIIEGLKNNPDPNASTNLSKNR